MKEATIQKNFDRFPLSSSLIRSLSDWSMKMRLWRLLVFGHKHNLTKKFYSYLIVHTVFCVNSRLQHKPLCREVNIAFSVLLVNHATLHHSTKLPHV